MLDRPIFTDGELTNRLVNSRAFQSDIVDEEERPIKCYSVSIKCYAEVVDPDHEEKRRQDRALKDSVGQLDFLRLHSVDDQPRLGIFHKQVVDQTQFSLRAAAFLQLT